MVKFVLFLFCFVVVLLASTAAQRGHRQRAQEAIECGRKGEVTLDRVTAELFMFNVDRRWPETDGEKTEYCRSNRERERFIRNYAKTCVKGLGQQVLSVMIYNIVKVNKHYCNKQQKRADFIKASPCANLAKKETKKCMNTLIAKELPITGVQDAKLKIPLTCCNYWSWKSCTLDAIRNKCDDDRVDIFEYMIDRQSVDFLALLCGDFTEDSDKCDTLARKYPKPNWKSGYKSPIIPMIKVLESL